MDMHGWMIALAGLLTGGAIGVVMMCLVQIGQCGRCTRLKGTAGTESDRPVSGSSSDSR